MDKQILQRAYLLQGRIIRCQEVLRIIKETHVGNVDIPEFLSQEFEKLVEDYVRRQEEELKDL